jgi:hypothetical protein
VKEVTLGGKVAEPDNNLVAGIVATLGQLLKNVFFKMTKYNIIECQRFFSKFILKKKFG